MPIPSIEDLPSGAKKIFESTMESLKGKTNSRTGKGYTDEERGKIAWSAVKKKYKKVGDNWVLKSSNNSLAVNSESISLDYTTSEDNGAYTSYKGITVTRQGVMNKLFKSNNEIQNAELPSNIILYADHIDDEQPIINQLQDYETQLGYGFGNNPQKVYNEKKEEWEAKYDLHYFNGEIDGFDMNKHIIETGKLPVSIQYTRNLEFLPDDKTIDYNGQTAIGLEKNIKIKNLATMINDNAACTIKEGCGAMIGKNELSDSDKHEIFRQMIPTGFQEHAYVMDIYEDYFVYEVSVGGTYVNIKQSYEIDENDKVTFTGTPEEVRRKTEYVTVQKNSIIISQNDASKDTEVSEDNKKKEVNKMKTTKTKETIEKNNEGDDVIKLTIQESEMKSVEEFDSMKTEYETKISELEKTQETKETELTELKSKLEDLEPMAEKWNEYETNKNKEIVDKIVELDPDENKEKLSKNCLCDNKKLFDRLVRMKDKFSKNSDNSGAKPPHTEGDKTLTPKEVAKNCDDEWKARLRGQK